MKVRFTPTGRRQFLAAIAYVHRENPLAARKLRDKSEKSLSRLVKFPESGRKIPEFPDLPYREVVAPPYRFFYRVEKSTVWVVACWRDSQLVKEPR